MSVGIIVVRKDWVNLFILCEEVCEFVFEFMIVFAAYALFDCVGVV